MSAEAAGVEWKLRAERSPAKLTFPPSKSEGLTLNPFIAGFMIYFTYISSVIRSYLLILDC